MIFHFYYKTFAGHGSRGSDIEADDIETAFKLAVERNPLIWEKARTKEFYVTPAMVKVSEVRWRYCEKYPCYTTFGIDGGKGPSLYTNPKLKNFN